MTDPIAAPRIDASTRFAAVFRASLHASVEYSISEDPEALGIMIPGDSSLLRSIEALVAGSSFASDWLTAASRLYHAIQPTASLFRVDWRRQQPVGSTIYFNFPAPPNDAAFARIVEHARPYRWSGPSPAAVAAVLELPGPSGIALRAMANGDGQLAVYYRMTAIERRMDQSLLSELAVVAGTGAAASLIANDVLLARPCELSVVGLDGDPAGALKFDLIDVPLRTARQLLFSRAASRAAWSRLLAMCTALRAERLTYLGMKYSEAGFAGWRAYLSNEPRRQPRAAVPRMMVDVPIEEGSRTPHY